MQLLQVVLLTSLTKQKRWWRLDSGVDFRRWVLLGLQLAVAVRRQNARGVRWRHCDVIQLPCRHFRLSQYRRRSHQRL